MFKKKIILIKTYFKHITIPLSTPLLALKLDWFAEAPGADWPLPLIMTVNQHLSQIFYKQYWGTCLFHAVEGIYTTTKTI